MSGNELSLAKPYIDEADQKGVAEVLSSGYLSLGPKLKRFEEDFAVYMGSKYACAVSSGTAGLHLAVKSLNLDLGSEIITSPFSFIASSNAILYENLKPVFVDIEEKTYNLDPEKIEQAITYKTKAVLVVHMFGQPANMDPIIKIAKKHKLAIIEDACESIGSRYENRRAGTLGDVGIFAFYPNKQMTTGEGGMIVTNSEDVYKLCLSLRNQGRNSIGELAFERLGYNYRMDEMSASLGITQLAKLDWMIEQRTNIASTYNKYLSGVPNVILPPTAGNRTNSWFVYTVRITGGKRDKVQRILESKGIHTRAYMPVIHLQPFMVERFGFRLGDFPVSEKIASEMLALPFYIGLKEDDVGRVARIISGQTG